MEYVSSDEFDAICARLKERRKAVKKAQRQLAAARTLAEKIKAKRAIAVAQSLSILKQE